MPVTLDPRLPAAVFKNAFQGTAGRPAYENAFRRGGGAGEERRPFYMMGRVVTNPEARRN